jgi:hypothetical protein
METLLETPARKHPAGGVDEGKLCKDLINVAPVR